MIVLGIDPGYERLGIAVIKKEAGYESVLYSSCFKTSKDLEFTERLRLVSEKVESVINKFKPETLAIENLFFNKNQKTVMKVSEVRGAIMSLCLLKGLSVKEFTPLQIKVAITGYGRSDKKQIIAMVKNLVKIKDSKKSDDEFDAIATGLTYLATEKVLKKTSI